ncbi:MAG TPA: RsmE family RNA methyltransferase [Candidatus Paceibacterota bacterium]|nr:RsmE family RNA methyltransferase [Candidatus Paceibacterota bacterium]
MKIHRFIDQNFDLNNKELEITGEIAHQVIKVLKFEIGEKIELSDGKGAVGIGKVKNLSKNTVLVEIEKIEKLEENKKTTLFCAVLKKENFELVVQKATECGIKKIVPIITDRTIKTGLKLDRLEKIAKEASEQSGRSIVPEISEPVSFEKSLELINKTDLNILFDISGEKFSEINLNDFEKINIFIGPEGGWTDNEIKKMKNLNFKIASLGKLTLRAETAAIVSSFLVSNN